MLRSLFQAEIFEKVSLDPIIFGSLDFQFGNPNWEQMKNF